MTKLFLIADKLHRFNANLGVVAPPQPACTRCGMPPEAPGDNHSVFWETEFSDAKLAISEGRGVFFSEGLAAYVLEDARDRMIADMLPVRFQLANFKEPDWLPDASESFWPSVLWSVRPVHWIDVSSRDFDICIECSHFEKVVWQVTRLKIDARVAGQFGIFGVSQNRGNAMFVTAEYREKLEALDLNGIGFYPAGKLV